MGNSNLAKTLDLDARDEIDSLVSEIDGSLALLGEADQSHVSRQDIWGAIAGIRRSLAQVGKLNESLSR